MRRSAVRGFGRPLVPLRSFEALDDFPLSVQFLEFVRQIGDPLAFLRDDVRRRIAYEVLIAQFGLALRQVLCRFRSAFGQAAELFGKEWRTRRNARFLAAIAFFFLFTLGF